MSCRAVAPQLRGAMSGGPESGPSPAAADRRTIIG